MMRFFSAVAVFIIIALPLRAADPIPRSQRVGEVSYFHVSLPIPEGTVLPKSLRQSVEKIAIDDLPWRPQLTPKDGQVTDFVWDSSNGKALEFLGRAWDIREITFSLAVPAMEKEKYVWATHTVTVDFAKAVRIEPRKEARTTKRSPQDTDLEGLWAAAMARNLAIRERMTDDFEYFRLARQLLCRKYSIADPMIRPDLIGLSKPNAEATIELSQLPEIEPAEHPWLPLLAGRKPIVEPLAQFVPRDCYYLRASDAAKFESILDPFAKWASSFAAWIDGNGRDYRLLERYQRQMLFPTDAAGHPRMPKHIHEFAVFGSDPHFRSGADVTVVFRLANAALFREDMDAAISTKRRETEYGGTKIESVVSGNGEMRMFRAFVDGFAVYSNSDAALRRAIDAKAEKIPSLASAPEFRLFRAALANDAREDVVGFASESFLRRQYGPAQVVGLRRREGAIAFVRALQYAAVLERTESKKTPQNLESILSLVGVKSDDPRLARWKIAWDAERGQIRSDIYNTAVFATPLIEIPTEKLSSEERESYLAFLEDARKNVVPWLAPVGIRVHFDDAAIHADLFAMPPNRATSWEWVRNRLGRGEVERPTAAPVGLLRAVASFASEPNDEDFIKEKLIKMGADPKAFQKHPQWRGERLSFHLDDGPALTKAIDFFLGQPSVARSTQAERLILSQLPATLGVEIRRPIIFVGWLNHVKELLIKTFPNVLTWEPLPGMLRGAKVSRIQLNQATMFLLFGKLLQPADAPSIYYAYNNRTLLIGLNPVALNNTVAHELVGEGRPPRRRAVDWVNAAVDLVPSAAPEAIAAIRTASEHSQERQMHSAAEIRRIWDGAPNSAEIERAALRQFGFAPSTASASLRIDEIKQIGMELRNRPDGLRFSVTIERNPAKK